MHSSTCLPSLLAEADGRAQRPEGSVYTRILRQGGLQTSPCLPLGNTGLYPQTVTVTSSPLTALRLLPHFHTLEPVLVLALPVSFMTETCMPA